MSKLVSGLIIVLVLLVVGWFAFSQRHRIFEALKPEKSTVDTRQASTPSGQKKPVDREKIKTRVKNVNKTSQPYASTSGEQASKTIAQKRSLSSGTLKSRPNLPVQKSKTGPRTTKTPTPVESKTPLKNTNTRSQPVQPSGSRPPSASAPTKQRSTGAPAPEKVAGGQNARFNALSAISDAELMLQAIAWSDDTARRMAVINNHIVREGETVDGYSVIKIREDDVIVNDGSTSWRLQFRLKQ